MIYGSANKVPVINVGDTGMSFSEVALTSVDQTAAIADLDRRLKLLETGVTPPSLGEFKFIPAGSTWDTIQTICGNAQDGDVVVLPNETMVQATTLVLPAKKMTLMGAGPNSRLVHKTNLSFEGQGVAVRARSGNRLFGFAIEADRAAIGPSGRTIGVSILSSQDVEAAYLTFKDITALCFNVAGGGTSQINLHHNTALEFYEQFIETSGWGEDITIHHNFAYSSAGNPVIHNQGGTEPCGIFLACELGPSGTWKNVVWYNNHIDLSALPMENQINSLGLTVSDGGQLSDGIEWQYNNIWIVNNFVKGSSHGIRVQNMRNIEGTGPGKIVIANNMLQWPLLEAVFFEIITAEYVSLLHNTFRRGPDRAHPFWNAVSGKLTFTDVDNKLIQDTEWID